MGQIGIWQIAIVAVVVIVLFGRGKISGIMGEVAKGITSFKKGLTDTEEDVAKVDEVSGDKIVDVTAEKTKTS